jgi:hypothetical protein
VPGSTSRADSARTIRQPAVGDTAAARPDSSVELERIVSRGSAQSLYHLQEKRDTTAAPTASPPSGINFLAGDVIDLRFEGGELHTAQVQGLKKGLYLDPEAPADSAAPADSTAAPGTTPAPPAGTPPPPGPLAPPGTGTQPPTSAAPSKRGPQG